MHTIPHLAAIGGSLLILALGLAAGARTVVDHWPAIRAALIDGGRHG